MAGYKFGQKIKRGINAGEHPASYTDFDAPHVQSPWAHEARQPWYAPLDRGANKLWGWLSGGSDKLPPQVDPLTASQQRTGDAGIAEDYFSSGDTANQVSGLSAPGPTEGETEVPHFIASQMAEQKRYTDPGEHALEQLTRKTSAAKALAQQTPSLAPVKDSSWWDFGSDEDKDLTHAGGNVVSIGGIENLDAVADKVLDKSEGKNEDDPYAGLTQNEDGIWLDEDGNSPKHLGWQIPNKKKKKGGRSDSDFGQGLVDSWNKKRSQISKEEKIEPSLLASLNDDIGPDHHDKRGETIDETPSWWSGLSGGGSGKGVSSNQKIAANLIKDIFAEPEQAPQQQIGASPLTPGKNFDMSYLKNKRPKRERYRNLGLLA